MISPTLLELERSIRTLSIQEQAWLLERIARNIRERTQTADKFGDRKFMQQQLAAMASDPEIQAELAAIDREFAITESDGLENL